MIGDKGLASPRLPHSHVRIRPPDWYQGLDTLLHSTRPATGKVGRCPTLARLRKRKAFWFGSLCPPHTQSLKRIIACFASSEEGRHSYTNNWVTGLMICSGPRSVGGGAGAKSGAGA